MVGEGPVIGTVSLSSFICIRTILSSMEEVISLVNTGNYIQLLGRITADMTPNEGKTSAQFTSLLRLSSIRYVTWLRNSSTASPSTGLAELASQLARRSVVIT